jgi:hypothetical protein
LDDADLDKMCDPVEFPDSSVLCEDIYLQRLEEKFPGSSQLKQSSHTYREFYKVLYNIWFNTEETYKSLSKRDTKTSKGRPPKFSRGRPPKPTEITMQRELITEYMKNRYYDVVYYFYTLGKKIDERLLPYINDDTLPENLQFIMEYFDKEDRDILISEYPVLLIASKLINKDDDDVDRLLNLLSIYFDNGYYIDDTRIVRDVMDFGNSSAKEWIKSRYDRKTGKEKIDKSKEK